MGRLSNRSSSSRAGHSGSLVGRRLLGRSKSKRKGKSMYRVISAALVIVLLVSAVAKGSVTVSISGSGSVSPASPSSGQAFTLTASTGSVAFTIYADSSTDVGHITLTGSATSVDILVGINGSFPSSQTSPISSSSLARDWGGLSLSSFSGSVRVAAKIVRDLTGSVTADQVYRLQIGNDI